MDDKRDPIQAAIYTMPVDNRVIYTEQWETVRNFNQFRQWILDNGLPDIVSFDHDLADEHYALAGQEDPIFKEQTGYDCAKWLCDFCEYEQLPLPICYVHSMNPVGSENIERLIASHRRKESLVEMIREAEELGLYNENDEDEDESRITSGDKSRATE